MLLFWRLLRDNPDYRNIWIGQVISEAGDHFNNIAVLSLTLTVTGSGAAVGAVILSRTVPALAAAPIAGLVLDRFDRKTVMVASDVVRAVIAALFVLTVRYPEQWLLYILSAGLMFASPFFTSGRSAVLPKITTADELHTANSLTQTTAWLTMAIGTMVGGASTVRFGYEWAFVVNALSFLVSAAAVAQIRGHFKPQQRHSHARRHFRLDLREGLAFMRAVPLIRSITWVSAAWTGAAGAAQILFTLFGQNVYGRGAAGIGLIWGCAAVGLVGGGLLGHYLGARLGYRAYLHAITAGLLIHGLAYVLFGITGIVAGCVFVALSRVAVGSINVQNRTMLLKHVPDELRGRVYTTVDAVTQFSMMLALAVASVATGLFTPRQIAVTVGLLSTLAAVPWALAAARNRLPEPATDQISAKR